jgi:hypothetical protein
LIRRPRQREVVRAGQIGSIDDDPADPDRQGIRELRHARAAGDDRARSPAHADSAHRPFTGRRRVPRRQPVAAISRRRPQRGSEPAVGARAHQRVNRQLACFDARFEFEALCEQGLQHRLRAARHIAPVGVELRRRIGVAFCDDVEARGIEPVRAAFELRRLQTVGEDDEAAQRDVFHDEATARQRPDSSLRVA